MDTFARPLRSLRRSLLTLGALTSLAWAQGPVQVPDHLRRDLRFSPMALAQEARVKVLSVGDAYPYYGIPNNGCAGGKSFVLGELTQAYDGTPAGQRVVLRLGDAAFPADRVGTPAAFNELKRAGRGPDGTFVYCGQVMAAAPGAASPAAPAVSAPPPPPAPPLVPQAAPQPSAPVATAPAPAPVEAAPIAAPIAAPATVAPTRPPLPPLPDNGPVTEVHKGKMGVIVFGPSADVVTTPEKPAQFKDTFATQDTIFFRAYLPRSLGNAFRAEGVDCSNDAFRTWLLKVDGQVVPRGKDDPYFYWEALDERGLNKSTSVRFDEPLNSPKKEGKAIWRAYQELVAPKLTAGEHTLTLELWGKCWAKNVKPVDVFLSAPLASGSFKLSVARGQEVSVLSPAGMKDPALEKEAVALIEAQWRGDKIQKLVLVGKAWEVETIFFKGKDVPQKRRLAAEAFVKQPSGKCRVFELRLIQPATSMTKFGATEFATGDSREVDCGALKGKE